MTGRRLWATSLVFVFVVSLALVCTGGCSSSSNGGINSSVGGPGVCESTCPKPCVADSDCQTSNGELCCDYGAAGKVCQSASSTEQCTPACVRSRTFDMLMIPVPRCAFPEISNPM